MLAMWMSAKKSALRTRALRGPRSRSHAVSAKPRKKSSSPMGMTRAAASAMASASAEDSGHRDDAGCLDIEQERQDATHEGQRERQRQHDRDRLADGPQRLAQAGALPGRPAHLGPREGSRAHHEEPDEDPVATRLERPDGEEAEGSLGVEDSRPGRSTVPMSTKAIR